MEPRVLDYNYTERERDNIRDSDEEIK